MFAASLFIILVMQTAFPALPSFAAAPDLTLEDIGLNNTNMTEAGSKTKFWAKVINVGDAKSAPFYLAFYVDGSLFDELFIDADIHPGSGHGYDESKSWTFPGGQHTLKVCVDTHNNNAESNESNNCMEETFGQGPPQKIATSIYVDVCVSTGSGSDCTANTISKNTNVQITIKGALTRSSDADGIRDKTVSLSWPGGSTSVTTDSTGGYSHTTTVYVSGSATFTASFAGDSTYEAASDSTTLNAVDAPTGDPELQDWYISPTTVEPGGSFYGYYTIHNPNSVSVSVMLGLSIMGPGSGEISDPDRDRFVNLSPGTNEYSRKFEVPAYLEEGEYDVALAIWDEHPDDGGTRLGWSGWMEDELTVGEGGGGGAVIEEEFDFSIDLDDSSATITASESVYVDIEVDLESGDPQSVALSCSGIPSSEASCKISPSIVEAGDEATLTITTGTGATPKPYIATITGTGGGLTRTAEFTLNVKPAVIDEIRAEIEDWFIENRLYEEGEYVYATIEVENTGSTAHTFYVGYSVQDETGKWFDAPYGSIYLEEGEEDEIMLSWRVQSGAPYGSYLARVAVYEGLSGSTLNNRFDYVDISDAFEVGTIETVIDAAIQGFSTYAGSYEPGDEVWMEVEVRNTGTVSHTFYVGFSVKDPNEIWQDAEHTSLYLTPGETKNAELSLRLDDDAISGAYTLRVAVWEEEDGDELIGQLDSSESEFSVLTVQKLQTRLTVTVQPLVVDPDESETLTMSGRLTDSNNNGLEGKTIKVTLYGMTKSVTTNSNGNYEAAFAVNMPAGEWTAHASFAGETLLEGSSSISSVTIASSTPEIIPVIEDIATQEQVYRVSFWTETPLKEYGVGKIRIGGIGSYSSISLNLAGSYSVTSETPVGYEFVRWVAEGGIDLDDSNNESTSISVNGPGTLVAIFDEGESPSPIRFEVTQSDSRQLLVGEYVRITANLHVDDYPITDLAFSFNYPSDAFTSPTEANPGIAISTPRLNDIENGKKTGSASLKSLKPGEHEVTVWASFNDEKGVHQQQRQEILIAVSDTYVAPPMSSWSDCIAIVESSITTVVYICPEGIERAKDLGGAFDLGAQIFGLKFVTQFESLLTSSEKEKIQEDPQGFFWSLIDVLETGEVFIDVGEAAAGTGEVAGRGSTALAFVAVSTFDMTLDSAALYRAANDDYVKIVRELPDGGWEYTTSPMGDVLSLSTWARAILDAAFSSDIKDSTDFEGAILHDD